MRAATADLGGSGKPLKRLERNFPRGRKPEVYPLGKAIFIAQEYANNWRSLVTFSAGGESNTRKNPSHKEYYNKMQIF